MKLPTPHSTSLIKLSQGGLRALVSALALTLALSLGFAFRASAQIYPAVIQLNVQPPYSPYLTDLMQPGQERIQLNINFLDQSEPSWDAKIRLSIEGNGLLLKTSRQYYQAVTLTPGPNLIDAVQVEQLLDFSKMDVQGTNKNDLVNAGRLPEGTYTFCVEVLDANREVAFALPGCYSATLIQNNPPQLVVPQCGAVISAAGGQNIQFNWIPMHDPSIQVRYEMKLVQVPTGMNENDAINGTSFPILDWLQINSTSFIYGPNELPLDLNQKYAFQIRVVDVNGLTTFENDGKAPVCWFTYGYSNDGTIDLTAPANQVRVDDPEKVDFAWSGPSNATPGQQLKYHIKVVKLATGERVTNQAAAAAYMDRTQGVWYDDSTDIMPNIYGGSMTVEQPLEPDAYYAWQVKSSTDGFKTAKSEIWEFKAPPVVYSFWCADGAYMVTVDQTNSITKVSPTKYSNLGGTGKVVLAPGEQPTEVSYSGLTVEMVANKWVLKVGEIVVPKTETKALDFGDFGDGSYDINAWVLTSMEFLAQGQVRWRFPLSVNAPGNAVVVSAENVRLNYLNKVLSGAVAFAENQSYDLLIPMGFKVKYKQPSQFIVAPGGVTTLKMAGNVYFPGSLKTVSGDPFSVPFENISNPWYMVVERQAGGEKLVLFSASKMTLQPKSFVVDFSGSQSPAGLFSGQPDWVGVYITEYNVFLPTDFDEKNQLSLTEQQVLTYVAGSPGYQPSWISSGGLNLDLSAAFENQNVAPYYARINTFQGKFSSLRLKIEDNSLSDSRFVGFLKVPFLDAQRKLDWVAPIAGNGIQGAYFNEDSLKAFSKTYNKGDTLSEVTLDINQAVFAGGDHIKMNVDLKWPKMQVILDNTPDLKIWGNGEIGFNEPNGKRDLTTQVAVSLGGMSGVADAVGAFYENGVYGFSMFTQVSLPGGITCPGAPIKVSVAGSGGAAAPPIVFTRVDGKMQSGKFRIGPIKLVMSNSLIDMDIFADYIDDDPVFGTRFEAKGNVMIKQPDPIVATARVVVSQSREGTKFWYLRCAAQGLNKVIEAYPAFSLNGFDFQAYHNLAAPDGMAFAKPNQFKDFWDLNQASNGVNSIDGLKVTPGVALGMFGKLGLHDTPSGKKQKSGPIDIKEGLPSIGDILPSIPGLCDLQYNGKSVCDYIKWPWEGLSLCDIYVPYTENGTVQTKSWCDVDLFKVNWPQLQFCNLRLSNGKKLGDFTLGELGFSEINLCDLKLPNGSGICEFFDIGGKFCDIQDANGPICNKKLCQLLPNLPPVCEWKFPGIKPLCNFNVGDLIPDMDLCAVVSATGGNSVFCNWSWPDIFPDVPNPCDFRLPNGTKLCAITASWCDIIVPVNRNGAIALVPLCEVKWWEVDWPNVNVCDWKIAGQPLCSLNFKFCDLRFPLSDEKPCDLIPNFCDLVEPISGKKFCQMSIFEIPWPNFNFCDLRWPATNRKICDINFGYCDFKNPINGQQPPLCNFNWRKLLPTIPNICNMELKMPNGSTKQLCSIGLNIEIPSICDLKLVDDLELCKIKLPAYNLPPMPNLPPIPSIPGLPENMYQWMFMAGLRVEVQNSGAVSKIAMDGNGWFFTYRLDPNSSYLARGFGGMEIFPQQKKMEFHLEGESGSVKTDIGTIKPVCATGKIGGFFKTNDWAIDVGTKENPLEVELGCVSALRSSGYIKARPNGLLAHGEIDKRAETSGGFGMEIGEIDFWAKASLYVAAEIGLSFDDPAIFGSIEADARASAGVDVTLLGDTDSYDFANVRVGGNLSFKVDSDFCLSGNLDGEVSILGIGVDLTVGVEVKNGNVSFPEDPDRCY